MSGGIITGRPFVLNPKCIVFSFYSSLLYFGGGGRSPLLIALIFIISYIILAWYDYIYECNDIMSSGVSPISPSGIFKPQYRSGRASAVVDQEKAYLQKVYFFHALIIAPMLIYIGYYQGQSNPNIWGFVGGMGGLAMIYHSYRIKVPREVWP